MFILPFQSKLHSGIRTGVTKKSISYRLSGERIHFCVPNGVVCAELINEFSDGRKRAVGVGTRLTKLNYYWRIIHHGMAECIMNCQLFSTSSFINIHIRVI